MHQVTYANFDFVKVKLKFGCFCSGVLALSIIKIYFCTCIHEVPFLLSLKHLYIMLIIVAVMIVWSLLEGNTLFSFFELVLSEHKTIFRTFSDLISQYN